MISGHTLTSCFLYNHPRQSPVWNLIACVWTHSSATFLLRGLFLSAAVIFYAKILQSPNICWTLNLKKEISICFIYFIFVLIHLFQDRIKFNRDKSLGIVVFSCPPFPTVSREYNHHSWFGFLPSKGGPSLQPSFSLPRIPPNQKRFSVLTRGKRQLPAGIKIVSVV